MPAADDSRVSPATRIKRSRHPGEESWWSHGGLIHAVSIITERAIKRRLLAEGAVNQIALSRFAARIYVGLIRNEQFRGSVRKLAKDCLASYDDQILCVGDPAARMMCSNCARVMAIWRDSPGNTHRLPISLVRRQNAGKGARPAHGGHLSLSSNMSSNTSSKGRRRISRQASQ